jgi:hypothetical protein
MAEVKYNTIDEQLGGNIRCANDCGRELEIGMPYAERLLSFAGDAPVVEVVCVYCAFITSDDKNFEELNKNG